MKTIEQKLPDTIKAEGFEAVMKAAPFLPIVDLTTLKEEQSEGRGGRIKTVFKIRKPTGADKIAKTFSSGDSKRIVKYSAPIVARVSGRMFVRSSGARDVENVVGGRVYEGGYFKAGLTSPTTAGECNESKPLTEQKTISPKSKTNKNMDLLAQLRKKYA